jgi:hypothetical protein
MSLFAPIMVEGLYEEVFCLKSISITHVDLGNYIESEDGDYGSIPSFYCSINIGDWDNSYVLIQK